MEINQKLLKINPRIYQNFNMTDDEIIEWFGMAEAYWLYQGEASSEKPHAELSSGLCSNGYFDCPRLLRYSNVCEILGSQLGRLLRLQGIGKVDWVISSAYSAITFGHEVAKESGAIFANVEKDQTDYPQQKRMLWRRMIIPAGSIILQAEELVTTLNTVNEVRRAVIEGNAAPVEFLPIVGALVHRPPKLPADYGEIKVIGLVEREVQAVKPEECSYCKIGSPRFRPKTNWKELTQKNNYY